jgi:hypothetical protein
MERNSSGALRAPGAFGARGTSDPHAILEICSLYITQVCSLAAVSTAAFGRAGASGAAAAFISMRVCRRAVASHARLLDRSGAAALLRPQHLLQRGLRPHRRLRRHSARPSHALRCCRIRLHWPATTPRPRAIPPNGRELRMKL